MKTNRTFYLVLGLMLIFTVAILALSLTRTVQATNTAYYVDCSAGSNGSGTQASPWNNLTTVNSTTFGAGDQILFKRGTTCTGTLHPLGSGASGNPIIVDAYSTGNKPIIAGAGASNAVYLYNQQYWEIRNLEVTNTGASSSNRRGVYIKLENYGTGNYYRLTNLTVHNVNGDNTKDLGGSSGIHFDVAGTTTQTRFNDVIVDGNTVYTTDRSGINMSSAWWCRASVGCSSGSAWYPWTSFIIRNNLVYDIGGDAIVMQYGTYALVEYNVVHDFNVRSGTYNAGIWAWNADNTTFQYNEAYLGRTQLDGQGFDIDYGQDGTIFQYNYGHDNEGGFMLICTGGVTDGTNNAIVRYNISQNDRARVFPIQGPVENLRIYNNTFYIGAGLDTCIICESYSNGNPVDVYFYNNIFYNLGSGGYTLVGNNVFDYNTFYGNHPASEPSDPHKLTSNPLLVNPGSGGTGRGTLSGYQLQAGSPALCSGKVIADNGGKDFWGNTVSSSSFPDRGAHQYSTNCATPTPTPTPNPGYNFVQNPGFETGSLSPWGNWNVSVVSSNVHTGTYALQVGTATGSSEQTISGLSPSTSYVLTGWVKTSSSSVTAQVGVKSFGGNETYQTSTSTSYTQLTVNFTTGSSNTTATVYCYKPTSSGYAYCDDFSVMVSGGVVVNVNGAGSGRTFEGEGVLSGGGGNTRLLYDYPEPYRSEILDYLFEPNFGASYHELKVEIGGDINSTSGTEPSHARTQAENANPVMTRGYETWLLSEAKSRNPNITTSGLEWGAPGWVGNFYSQNNADYLVSYILGLQNVWGINLDYIGGNQNESFNGTSTTARDYIVNILRPTLNSNGLSNVKIVAPDILSTDWAFANQIISDSALKNSVYAIGYHYVQSSSTYNAQNSGLPIWESEGWTGIGDWAGAYNLASEMNLNYVNAKITKTDVWHAIHSAYNNVNWAHSGIMEANTPWSGYYIVQPAVWAAAHTNQFAQPGWQYLDSGCGTTPGGGSYVTFKKPSTGDYSIVIVTGSTQESMTFNLSGGLSTSTVHVWKSNSTAQFIQQSDITPSGSSFTISLAANSIYSLTTTTGQQKGVAAHAIPTNTSFPSTYSDNFDSYTVGTTPKYTQDTEGAFEVASKYGGSGNALRQVITGTMLQWNSWGDYPHPSAFTELGDMDWQNYDVSSDVLIENSGAVALYGRVGSAQAGGNVNDYYGYRLSVYTDGKWWLCYGSAYTYETGNDVTLASGTLSGFSANTWHNLKLSFSNSTIRASIDGAQVAYVTDSSRAKGMVGLGSGWNNAQFDNLTIYPNAGLPTPTPNPSYNYVQNPGFETGSLSPWSNWNNSVVASNANTGTYSMEIGTATGSGEQTISGLSPNTAYVLKGWVKTSATSVTAQVGVKNFGGTEAYQTSTSTSYTELTVNFTTGSSNTTALIYCHKPTSSGYAYCDDFSVKAASSGSTPTPTNTPVPTNTPTRTSTPTNTATPSNSGWVSPASNAAATGGDGNGFQTNPANAYSDNATFAVDTDSGTNTSTSCSDTGKDRHVFYGYNLTSIPVGSTIVGLEVQLQMKVDSTTGSPKSCIELSWDGGTSWTSAQTSSTFTKTEASYTLGGAANTWGHTWTTAELSNLRVRITNVASNTSRDFSMDWIPVRVSYR